MKYWPQIQVLFLSLRLQIYLAPINVCQVTQEGTHIKQPFNFLQFNPNLEYAKILVKKKQ
jgi:hypothetical protein